MHVSIATEKRRAAAQPRISSDLAWFGKVFTRSHGIQRRLARFTYIKLGSDQIKERPARDLVKFQPFLVPRGFVERLKSDVL